MCCGICCDCSRHDRWMRMRVQGYQGLGYYRDKPPTPAAAAAKPSGGKPPAKPKVILGNNSIIKGLAPKPGGVVKRRKSGAALQPVRSCRVEFECSWRTRVAPAAWLYQQSAAVIRAIATLIGRRLTPWTLVALLKQTTPRSQPICGKWKHGRGKHARTMMRGAPWSSSACVHFGCSGLASVACPLARVSC
jgi:hypothetical protein